MIPYALRRLAAGVPLLLAVSAIAYLLLYRAADPAARLRQTPGVRAEDVRRLVEQRGLDQPWHEGWLTWLGHFVRGDWGSGGAAGGTALERIGAAAPATLELVAVVTLASFAVAAVLGIAAASRPGSGLDLVVSGAGHLGVAVPTFLLGLLLQLGALWVQDHGWAVLLLAAGAAAALAGLWRVRLGGRLTVTLTAAGTVLATAAIALWGRLGGDGAPLVFTGGRYSPGREGEWWSLDHLQHLALPALTLTLVTAAVWTRYARAVSGEVLAAPHVVAARARGLSEPVVLGRHAARLCLAPLVTVACVDVGALIGGAVVTETLFSWPGLGRLLVSSALARDVDVAMGIVMLGALAVLLMNLVADLAHAALDPRVTLGTRAA